MLKELILGICIIVAAIILVMPESAPTVLNALFGIFGVLGVTCCILGIIVLVIIIIVIIIIVKEALD